MKVRFVENTGLSEPEFIISAARLTPELQQLMDRLGSLDVGPVIAYRDECAVPVEQNRILRFFTDGKGVSLQTPDGVYSVRERLYELENRLDAHTFVRISHSEIVNLRHVTAIDLSLTGTIKMTLTGNIAAYVSRRYMKKIRQAVGL